MSTPGGPALSDGLYSKLIDEEHENFPPHQRPAASSVRPSTAQRGPGLGLSPGPGLYRASTVALAALCVILLICVVAVSSHKQKPESGGDALPQTEKQQQQFNVSELQSIISRLQEENQRLWEKINSTQAPPQCLEDWRLFNGSCFLVSRRSRSWSDAQEFCVSQGAHLAIILTAEEQSFVWEQLPRGHWNAYWIGITDSHTEDQWHWVDGTPLVRGFWEDGEPNNHIDEDCGYIVKTRVLERVAVRSWYDAPCSMSWPFVCETAAGSGVAAGSG